MILVFSQYYIIEFILLFYVKWIYISLFSYYVNEKCFKHKDHISHLI